MAKKATKPVEEKAPRPFVEHPDLGKCYILGQTEKSTYIEMFDSGRCHVISKKEPHRTKDIQFAKELEKEPCVCQIASQQGMMRITY